MSSEPAAPASELLFNPFDAAWRADPYRHYRRLRTEEPVHRSPIGVWVLSRYDDIVPLLRDPAFSADPRNIRGLWFLDMPGAEERVERRAQTMLFMDPPAHTRLRGLVHKAFTPKVIEGMRAHLADVVAATLDELGDTFDVVGELAYPVSMTMIAELLGVPAGDRAMFRAWSMDLTRALDPFQPPEMSERIEAAALSFDRYFSQLIDERRRAPRGGMIDGLIAAEEQGDRLSERELLALCRLLLVAGHETTVNLIGNGMLAMLRAPEELRRLREGEVAIDDAVEELLRFDSPVQLTARTALEPRVIGGQQVQPHELCLFVLGAANRDPARFADPDRLDLARGDRAHLSFGGGPHFCLGAPLARLEAATVLPALLERFPKLELAEEPEWRDNVTLRGLAALHLRAP